VAHNDAVLRHFVVCLPRRFRLPRKDPGKKNPWQRDRDSGAILLAFKLSTASCQALKHPSWNSWQPSCDLVSVLHSLVSCILPQSISFLGRHYSRGLYYVTDEMPPDWPTIIPEHGTRME